MGKGLLIGFSIAGAEIFTVGTVLEGLPWALRLEKQQSDFDPLLTFKDHGAEQAQKRGFTKEIVEKIKREGKAVKSTGRYGPQTKYTLGKNTVVVNDKNQVVTVYSSDMPSGNFIPFNH